MVILSVNADQLLSIPSCWLLFRTLFLVISLLLSPSSQLAVSHYLVKFLPGFEGPLPFQLETGYVGVDESEDVQLFYYFVKSDSNPKEDPLVLWFTGGPGCSSFTAFAYEIGPLNFEAVQLQENGSLPKLVLNPNSWTKGASIIFVDLPVGTGFSYPRTSVASHSTDLQSCDQAYQFMMKWLIDHPEFLMNPFYVGGDSYSGITVPPVAQMISDGNEIGNKPFINLKGYVLGNPVTFLNGGESNYAIPFAYGKGLISGELFESLQRNCQGEYFNVDPSNADCLQDVQAYYQCTNGLQAGQILEPVCGFASPKPSELFSKRSLYAKNWEHVLPEHSLCAFARVDGYRISYRWLDEDSVREALHIRKGSIGKWIRCNYGVSYTYTFTNSYQYHVNLSAKGYRSLIYSGDHDMIVPFLATQAWIRSLNYSIVDDWRSWIVQGQVAGYTRTYSNRMTYATVKGGGHTAPEYKPLECLAMFKRWISHKPL